MISKVIEYFNSMRSNTIKAAHSVAYETANNIYNQVKKNSPIDSGRYQSSWVIRAGVKTKNTLASYVISNNTPYGETIEMGSEPEIGPWPRPGKKTILIGSKIWSTQAIGGTIDQTINNIDTDKLISNMSDGILGAIR